MLALNQYRQLSAVLSLERADDLSSRVLYPPWSDMLCSHLKCASITFIFLFTNTYSLSLDFAIRVRVQLNEQLFPEAFSHQLTLAQYAFYLSKLRPSTPNSLLIHSSFDFSSYFISFLIFPQICSVSLDDIWGTQSSSLFIIDFY